MQEAVGQGSSPQPCHSWLVRNRCKKYIKMILKGVNMFCIHAS